MRYKMLALLTLLLTIATIKAQTPPLPPMPQLPPMPNMVIPNFTNSMTNLLFVFGQAQTNHWRKPKLFIVNCIHCGIKYKGLPALNIVTNGMIATNGGMIVQRTITLRCPNEDCTDLIQAKNIVFVPESVAVEEDSVPASAGAGSGASTAVQTWTTDPMLRLSIKLTNCLTPIIWPTSASIPSGAPTYHSWYSNGVLVITNTGFISITNPVVLNVMCGPVAVISYTTQIGKIYKCQASEDTYTNGDPRKVWYDGPLVPGTGMPVVQYENAAKPIRTYRVSEL